MVLVKHKSKETPNDSVLSYRASFNNFIFDPHQLFPVCVLLFLFEIILNIIIIEKVKYTEIDWRAYMQEVEGFLNGTLDYKGLKGDTGPLVYPAGFVYIYSLLYYVTSGGQNIYLAQYIFLGIYLIHILLYYRILIKTAKIPPYALIIATLTSYRIHSIFVLRLFNDTIAVTIFYISINLFISNKWILGSIFYSLAVSVKMNILLYAPCLLIAYLTNLTYVQCSLHLFLCGAIQIILGFPFLYTNMYSYLKGSFDLGRVFDHTWTVNYRFLHPTIFESHYFHIFLLLLHILLLLLFLPLFKKYLSSYSKLNVVVTEVKKQLKTNENETQNKIRNQKENKSRKEKQKIETFKTQYGYYKSITDDDFYKANDKLESRMSKVSQLFILPFFVTNFIGIVCARSLHYQFYSWYFHSLLYLAFCTPYKKPLLFLILGLIEYSWNVYPSTAFSSLLLHACHIVLLYGLYSNMNK